MNNTDIINSASYAIRFANVRDQSAANRCDDALSALDNARANDTAENLSALTRAVSALRAACSA